MSKALAMGLGFFVWALVSNANLEDCQRKVVSLDSVRVPGTSVLDSPSDVLKELEQVLPIKQKTGLGRLFSFSSKSNYPFNYPETIVMFYFVKGKPQLNPQQVLYGFDWVPDTAMTLLTGKVEYRRSPLGTNYEGVFQDMNSGSMGTDGNELIGKYGVFETVNLTSTLEDIYLINPRDYQYSYMNPREERRSIEGYLIGFQSSYWYQKDGKNYFQTQVQIKTPQGEVKTMSLDPRDIGYFLIKSRNAFNPKLNYDGKVVVIQRFERLHSKWETSLEIKGQVIETLRTAHKRARAFKLKLDSGQHIIVPILMSENHLLEVRY